MEAMDESKSAIEKLHPDILKEIMLRVAAPPNGGVEVFNTFFICKAFHDLSDNQDLLRAIVLDDLSTYCVSLCHTSSLRNWLPSGSPDLASEFEAFEKIGGYIHRVAKAGNRSAQIILAKLIMRSASELQQARYEASTSKMIRPIEKFVHDKLIRRGKASSFIAHFMPDKNDDEIRNGKKLLHYQVVKTFLAQENLEEVQKMKQYIRNYVTYFYHSRVEKKTIKFLWSLSELDEGKTKAMLRLTTYTYMYSFKSLCVMWCKVMRDLGLNIKLQYALEMSVVREMDLMKPKELIDRFTIVETLIMNSVKDVAEKGSSCNSELINGEFIISTMVKRIAEVRKDLYEHVKLVQFIDIIQAQLVVAFEQIFS